MIKIGLTGSIGSGKSLVAKIFDFLDVPVYNADYQAKVIINSSLVLSRITEVFGKIILNEDQTLNRKLLAEIVFNDKEKLEKLNHLVHPLVKNDFEAWCNNFHSMPYVIQEAAILYESGLNLIFDKIVLVRAPQLLCIERVMKRDNVSAEMVKARMSNQWDQEHKAKLADYIIENDEVNLLIPQVLKLHKEFLSI